MEVDDWVKVTNNATGEEVYVQVRGIKYVAVLGGTTQLVFSNDLQLAVKETVKEVMEAIDEAS